MKYKNKYVRTNRYTVALLITVLALTAGAIVLVNHGRTKAAHLHQPVAVHSASKFPASQFTFVGTANWWQGATNQTSIALFHSVHDSCFVSLQYKTGTVAAEQAKRQKTVTDLQSNGYIISPPNTQTLTLKTTTGPKQYQLVSSSVGTPTGQNKLDGGQEFGYLQLSSSYIFIEGHCETKDQLQATIPALEAVTFKD